MSQSFILVLPVGFKPKLMPSSGWQGRYYWPWARFLDPGVLFPCFGSRSGTYPERSAFFPKLSLALYVCAQTAHAPASASQPGLRVCNCKLTGKCMLHSPLSIRLAI